MDMADIRRAQALWLREDRAKCARVRDERAAAQEQGKPHPKPPARNENGPLSPGELQA